jgi:undecaprenyl diphosphate synthase
MDEAEGLTAGGEYQLNIAVDYGGRWDIVEAAKKLAADVKANKLAVEDITEELFTSACQLSDIAPPDLLIRTGGQQRISNYLLWQCAYTEFYFTPELWPDFNAESLKRALIDYAGRQRRFGKTSEQIAAQGS